MNAELVSMAYPFALDALDDTDRRNLLCDLGAADEDTRTAFADEVRHIRETLAALSCVGDIEPPSWIRAELLVRIETRPHPVALDQRYRRRWRITVAAAAAVGLLAGGAVITGTLTDTAPGATEQQILRAADLQVSTVVTDQGGSATIGYSPSADAVVVTLQNVPPPAADSVYQMWLISEAGTPHSAGLFTGEQINPVTTMTVDDVGAMSALAWTVEPPGGSAGPTTRPFVTLHVN
ncbi:anti-sigma factor (plasmid) [Rhodococcus sp. ZPP]|uniref:anti-sigma factor n=1 Tax=Rhodococcus sp. ZPP TaxID=2749906 RepID=UPI001AD8620F|nr:anti-sigma factor [Rhodococcus sp. ZPP]QTJ70635.1 anti-sigma factor [Rhodococcus sp. ZPP]